MDRAAMPPRPVVERDERGKFAPGNRGGNGRQRGQPNRINRTLRECVLMAGEIVGADGKGKDGLLGYLATIARRDPRTYVMLLGRLMPIDVHSTKTEAPVTYRSSEEVMADMRARGLDPGILRAAFDRMERAKLINGGGLNGGGDGLN